jgi:hypothetical protein
MKPKRRPDFSLAVHALMAHISATMPEFRHIKAAKILVVSGEARRASRGTVKPMHFGNGTRIDEFGRQKPVVKIKGKRVFYTITLRPLFFRKSTARERVATILHELFHISEEFDGTLHSGRRHDEAGDHFDAEFEPLEKKYWKLVPAGLKALFSYNGEVRVNQWLEKPQSWAPGEKASHRATYSEAHLFEGIMRMKTKQKKAEEKKSLTSLVH